MISLTKVKINSIKNFLTDNITTFANCVDIYFHHTISFSVYIRHD